MIIHLKMASAGLDTLNREDVAGLNFSDGGIAFFQDRQRLNRDWTGHVGAKGHVTWRLFHRLLSWPIFLPPKKENQREPKQKFPISGAVFAAYFASLVAVTGAWQG